MNSILQLSAKKLVNSIITKQISSEEVVKAYLARIKAVNPQLNAVVQLDIEGMIHQAQQADQLLAKGKILGKLHGLPITVKDTCEVKGFTCTSGTLGYASYRSTYDATCVARLRAEGAIIMGLTNMAEVGCAFETNNLVYGRTNNPYNLNYTPGGSSGGEAAIIAANGSPLGLGADGGGSIRVPAHFCGIAGIKPTQGRVPLTGLLVPKDGIGLVNQIGTFGPMARYVEDLALILPIISGPDSYDSHIPPVVLQEVSVNSLKSLRIAFYTDNGIAKPTLETIATVQQVAQVLAGLGYQVKETQPDGMENTYQLLWGGFFEGGDGGLGLTEFLKAIGSMRLSVPLQQFLANSMRNKMSVTEFHNLLGEVDLYRTRLLAFMEPYDVIICPVCATPAKRHDSTYDEITDFTYTMTYNLTGWPSTVVRCGTSLDGLPIGVQVIAKPWRDDISLAVAMQLEMMLGGYQSPNL